MVSLVEFNASGNASHVEVVRQLREHAANLNAANDDLRAVSRWVEARSVQLGDQFKFEDCWWLVVGTVSSFDSAWRELDLRRVRRQVRVRMDVNRVVEISR